MKYQTIDKPPHEAIAKVKEIGGRLYDGHYCYSVVSGSSVYTYWKQDKDSIRIRGEVAQLCKDWNLNENEMSPGRLIRTFLKQIGLQPAEKLPKTNKARFYGVKFEYLARDRPIHCRLRELLEYYQSSFIKDSPDSIVASKLLSQVISLCIELRRNGQEQQAKEYERVISEAWDVDELFLIASELGIDNLDLKSNSSIEDLDQFYGFSAMQGKDSHWHYLYLSENPTGIGIELDIKAAYLTSFLQEKTIYWYDGGYKAKSCWLPDNGVMNRLREYDLPKWFRLQLLGMLSSHQRTFYYPKKDGLLERNAENVIQWGAAFNTTHKAIYRVYALMREIHKLGGKWIHRMHTDSFLLDITTPREVEEKITDFLTAKGFKLSCKGMGYFHFFNRDLGFIGSFEKGEKRILEEEYSKGIKPKRTLFPAPIFDKAVERWSHYLPEIPSELRGKTDLRLRPLKDGETFNGKIEELKGVWINE